MNVGRTGSRQRAQFKYNGGATGHNGVAYSPSSGRHGSMLLFCISDTAEPSVTFFIKLRISNSLGSSFSSTLLAELLVTVPITVPSSASCFLTCRSRLVCCENRRLHRLHLKFRSCRCMLRTCRCRLDDMLNDRSQCAHRYGCSPVCVRTCLVRLALRGNTLPQYLHAYRSLDLTAPPPPPPPPPVLPFPCGPCCCCCCMMS